MAAKDPPAGNSIHVSGESIAPNHEGSLSSLGRDSPLVTLPFQQIVYDLTGTENDTYSTTVSNLSTVRHIIRPFREARLASVEAVMFVSAQALKIPVTVDLVWTSADETPTGSQVLNTPGGVRLTGGGLSCDNQYILPANLIQLNPIIKSHIPYRDQPRLTIHFH